VRRKRHMAFVKIEENPFSSELMPLSKLTSETFNPRDYIDFSSIIKVDHDSLDSIADVGGNAIQGVSVRRLKSRHIDRATGELYEPTDDLEDIQCVKFEKGDILFHKYAGRIGRIGIADFEGVADSHFMIVKPKIDGHYLLLALRSPPVLLQLPYRETARPGIWNDDLAKLRIPRLKDLEVEMGNFIREVFGLRSRAEKVMGDLLESFDMAISSKMPTDYSFFMGTQILSEETLDPGYYFMKAIEMMLPEHIVLGDEVTVIYPSSLNAGEEFTAVTLSDYRFEGIVPQKLKGVERLWERNFARPGDIILNRLHSSGEKIAKATVVLPNIDYLSSVGVTLSHLGSIVRVPIYDQLFILRLKQKSRISPYYFSVVFNSNLFQRMFKFMMSGSTGRQRLRKTKLDIARLPVLSEHMMKAFSEATRISMEVMSETLRMLIHLHQVYKEVAYGIEKPEVISTLIGREREVMRDLVCNSIEEAEAFAMETSKLEYKIRYPSSA
jgi:hypothetical protein